MIEDADGSDAISIEVEAKKAGGIVRGHKGIGGDRVGQNEHYSKASGKTAHASPLSDGTRWKGTLRL
jgi:hypothetical protein